MTPRLISEPRPRNAPPIPLRIVACPGRPAFLAPPFADLFDLFWLAPIVCEGPAPLPSRRFDHVAKILAQPALGESETSRRN